MNLFKKAVLTKKPRPMLCLFYSHIWTVYCLEELGLLNTKSDIIIELAVQSHFAPALNSLNKYHENLLALLQPNKHLELLGTRFKSINAPFILAPNLVTPVNTVTSALSLVSTDNSPIERAIIVVNIHDAPQFMNAYSYMNQFNIVWDIADYPNAALPALAQLLVSEEYITAQTWGGIHLCHHKQRQLENSSQREKVLRELINEFPAVKMA